MKPVRSKKNGSERTPAEAMTPRPFSARPLVLPDVTMLAGALEADRGRTRVTRDRCSAGCPLAALSNRDDVGRVLDVVAVLVDVEDVADVLPKLPPNRLIGRVRGHARTVRVASGRVEDVDIVDIPVAVLGQGADRCLRRPARRGRGRQGDLRRSRAAAPRRREDDQCRPEARRASGQHLTDAIPPWCPGLAGRPRTRASLPIGSGPDGRRDLGRRGSEAGHARTGRGGSLRVRSGTRWSERLEDASRVEDPQRIERRLDRAHHPRPRRGRAAARGTRAGTSRCRARRSPCRRARSRPGRGRP